MRPRREAMQDPYAVLNVPRSADQARIKRAYRELAKTLQIPKHNMLTQLAEWTRLGFITRTHAGSYALVRTDDRTGTAQCPQRGDAQRSCAATGGLPAPGLPNHDTLSTACWT